MTNDSYDYIMRLNLHCPLHRRRNASRASAHSSVELALIFLGVFTGALLSVGNAAPDNIKTSVSSSENYSTGNAAIHVLILSSAVRFASN